MVSTWVTQSMTLLNSPLELAQVVLVGGSTASGTISLYNGRDTSGEKLFTVIVSAEGVTSINYPDGLILNQGLYVELDSNVSGVQVIWRPV